MATRHRGLRFSRPAEVTFLILGSIAIIYFAAEVLKPLALATLLAFALTPATTRLERRGMPRALAVLLSLSLVLGILGGVGYVVGHELAALASSLPRYQGNIESKLRSVFALQKHTPTDGLVEMVDRVTENLEEKPPGASPANPNKPAAARKAEIPRVQVVEQPSLVERLRDSLGPYLEFLGLGGFVLILVLFMLMGRENLRDRIVTLFGHRRIGLTTRTMEEISQRISRYLATVVLVNTSVGILVGLGVTIIGLPYGALWGTLAALLRFIPYVGPAGAFFLPFVFSIAHFTTWRQPLEVVGFFATMEILLNSFLEPVIYGKSTGVSALGLLIAAMFWTWLWGSLGLLLSTPLTVCLAVLGKYVPGLRFLAIMLGEDAELSPSVRLYQRLVALNRDGALEVIREAARTRSRESLCDDVILPALAHSERDALRGELDLTEQTFVETVISDAVEELAAQPATIDLTGHDAKADPFAPAADLQEPSARILVVGIADSNSSARLALELLQVTLPASKVELEIIAESLSPLALAERVSNHDPAVVIVSHMPPNRLQATQYLLRRLRARHRDLPILVGYWRPNVRSASINQRLLIAGATQVVFSISTAREQLLSRVPGSRSREMGRVAPLPA